MKIAVLAGGISTERDVSLSSGGMIYRALRARGHQAVLVDVYLGVEGAARSAEHTSEHQSHYRMAYTVYFLKKKKYTL